MKEVKEYYETHVKKWVEIAQDIYEAEGQKRIKLVKDFGLEDVRDIDIELIVEYFRRFDTIERDHVWEGSPANPLYYCAVVAQAFSDRYWQILEKEKDRKAYEELHETVDIADGFYETLDGFLSSDSRERKEQYTNLIIGIYNNEIKKQIDSEESKTLRKRHSQFNEDLNKILRKSHEIANSSYRNQYLTAKKGIDYFLSDIINEEFIVQNYRGRPGRRKVIEGLIVELHMMQTAINDYLEKQQPF